MADRLVPGKSDILGSDLLRGLGLVGVPDGAPGPLSSPRVGRVRLRTVDKRIDVVLRLDDEPASMTTQLPRVEQVEIAYRAARSWWAGQSAGELQIPCLLDGYPDRSVEQAIADLEDMARPRSAGKASGAPSPVQVAGNVPGTDRLWMLTGIDQREAIWKPGFRVRQHFDLRFTQWLPLEQADTGGRKNPRTAAGKVKRRPSVVVQRGDTLASIALRVLGRASDWKKIASANKVKGKPRRSPADLKVGEKLRMPQG